MINRPKLDRVDPATQNLADMYGNTWLVDRNEGGILDVIDPDGVHIQLTWSPVLDGIINLSTGGPVVELNDPEAEVVGKE